MFVKYKSKGSLMAWFLVVGLIIKLLIILAWFFQSQVNFINIIEHIELVINEDVKINLIYCIKQLGWVGLKLLGAIGLEFIIAFGVLLPLANRTIQNNMRW